MAGLGTSLGMVTNSIPKNNDEIYKVQKPRIPNEKSSREMRDSILIKHFGYTESDIKDLDQRKPGYFYISDRRNDKIWATADYIRSWTPDNEGYVEITMTKKLVENLRLFRENRAETQIIIAVSMIDDAALKQQIFDDLKIILSSFGQNRRNAFDNLMAAITSSGVSRNGIKRALRFLTNDGGYSDNPFLLLGLAYTSFYKNAPYELYSGSGDALRAIDYENFINKSNVAVDVVASAANRSFLNATSKTALNKIDNSDASSIHGWISRMYHEQKRAFEETSHRWTQRFFAMTPEERNSFKEGDIIEMNPDADNNNNNSMSAPPEPSVLEKEFIENEKKRAKQKEMDDQLSGMNPGIPKTDHITSDYFHRPTDNVGMPDGLKKQKKRQSFGKKYVPKYKSVDKSLPVFRDYELLNGSADVNAIALVGEITSMPALIAK